MVEEINHSESSSWEVIVDLANFFNKYPISHTRLVLALLGDANQVLIFQSTLPSQLSEPSCMGYCSNQAIFEIFSQEFEHRHIVGESTLHFPSWSSVMSNIFQFINLSYGWLEKVYKDQFHLFSIFKRPMGLISLSVSLHYNLILPFFLEQI